MSTSLDSRQEEWRSCGETTKRGVCHQLPGRHGGHHGRGLGFALVQARLPLTWHRCKPWLGCFGHCHNVRLRRALGGSQFTCSGRRVLPSVTPFPQWGTKPLAGRFGHDWHRLVGPRSACRAQVPAAHWAHSGTRRCDYWQHSLQCPIQLIPRRR